jgi:hypothetical protein
MENNDSLKRGRDHGLIQEHSGADEAQSKKHRHKKRRKDKAKNHPDDLKGSKVVRASEALDKEEEEAEEYSYVTDDADHCETPLDAYEHIATLLDRLISGKARSSLRIYDPYFCEGGVVQRLGSLGFTNVYNRKEDFYAAIVQGTTPDFDVLVTNPPYSGDNISRLLDFCLASRKPWFLLVPNWVYTKNYYARILCGGSSYIYVAPKKRYLYLTVKGRRQQKSSKYTSPFVTFWYCSLPPHVSPAVVRAAVDAKAVDVSFGTPSSLPLVHLDQHDPRKKREKNNMKRKKHAERKKKSKSKSKFKLN